MLHFVSENLQERKIVFMFALQVVQDIIFSFGSKEVLSGTSVLLFM